MERGQNSFFCLKASKNSNRGPWLAAYFFLSSSTKAGPEKANGRKSMYASDSFISPPFFSSQKYNSKMASFHFFLLCNLQTLKKPFIENISFCFISFLKFFLKGRKWIINFFSLFKNFGVFQKPTNYQMSPENKK